MSAGVEREQMEAVSPRDEEGVVAALAEVAARKGTVVPIGRGGRTPHRLAGENAVLLSTARMDKITRFRPDDLTISAQAGCSLGDLYATVTRPGLWLPIDFPGDARDRTLGGFFAEGLAGPLAYGFPHPRDLLLGLTAILADGTRFKTGSRVVKNVAGFDIAKLFVGSRGTLFVATEFHVRLRPSPGSLLWASDTLPPAEVGKVLLTLRKPPFAFSSLTIVSEGKGCRVIAECLDRDVVALWHGKHVAPLTLRQGDDARALRDLKNTVSFPSVDWEASPCTSGAVLPSRIPALVESLPASATFAVQGHGGFVVHGHDVLATVETLGGHGRFGAKETPRPEAVLRLEREMKRALDPGAVLWSGGKN